MSRRAYAVLTFFGSLCFLLFLTAEAAQPNPALKEKVKKLVEQLADADEKKQEAAAAELAKLGPDVLPLLPGPAEFTKLKPIQRQYLTAIMKSMKDAQAQKVLTPRTVTIKDDAIPLLKALEEIAKQTEIKVEDLRREKDDPKLKLNLEGVTFWQALDAIAKEADLKVYPYHSTSIALVEGPYVELPTSYNGMFRSTIKRVAAIRDLETDTHVYIARVELTWEPRFRPFLVDTRPQSLVVKDDKNKELPVPDEGGGKAPVESPYAMTVDIRLPAPPRSVNKLNLLKGQFVVVGPSKMLEFTFDTLDVLEKDPKAREQTKEGITVKIAKPTFEKIFWKLEVSLEYPPDGPEFESFQSWLVNNEIYLMKNGGKDRFPMNGGYATDSVAKNRAGITYNFVSEKKMPLGKPGDWQVVYRTPGAIVELLAGFEFKDVPLP